MAEAFVNVTEGSGKKLHAFDKTIGANTVLDEITQAGIPYYATYTLPITGISIATAGSHVIAINAGASLNVYIMRIELFQAASATAAAYIEWSIRRTSTAPSAGTGVTPVAVDPADAAAGCTALTLPTKGTETTVPYRYANYLTQTPGAAGAPMNRIFDWRADENNLYKPLKIAAGTTNGIGIRNDTGHAAATVTGTVTIIETAAGI